MTDRSTETLSHADPGPRVRSSALSDPPGAEGLFLWHERGRGDVRQGEAVGPSGVPCPCRKRARARPRDAAIQPGAPPARRRASRTRRPSESGASRRARTRADAAAGGGPDHRGEARAGAALTPPPPPPRTPPPPSRTSDNAGTPSERPITPARSTAEHVRARYEAPRQRSRGSDRSTPLEHGPRTAERRGFTAVGISADPRSRSRRGDPRDVRGTTPAPRGAFTRVRRAAESGREER